MFLVYWREHSNQSGVIDLFYINANIQLFIDLNAGQYEESFFSFQKLITRRQDTVLILSTQQADDLFLVLFLDFVKDLTTEPVL